MRSPKSQSMSRTKAARIASRWIPANSLIEEMPELDAVLIRYTSPQNNPMALIYKGTAGKPAMHFRYRDEVQREQSVKSWIDSTRAAMARSAVYETYREQEFSAFMAQMKTGAVFYFVSGYEQSNAHFFEVVGVVTKKTVEARPIAQDQIESAPLAMSGHATPRKGDYTGEMRKIRIDKHVPKLWADGLRVPVSWYG